LTISGTSIIDKINALSLVNGDVTIENGAKVTLLNVDELSPSYAPTIKINSGAIIGTLNLNSIAKTNKIAIEKDAKISKIIHNGDEYSSIEAFKESLKKP
jgi:hypothetical protein